jgi:predicted AlkP superfamily phosphohydrolase/phosphomutase
MRTAKSIWNILSERGFRVGVVGWYVTWPAEAVNGFMVTERALLYPDDGRKTDPGLTYPEDLFESIRGFNIDPKNLTEESLDWLSQPRLSGGASHTDLTRVVRQNLGAARKTYARDLSSLAISLHLIETYDALDVLLIYFRAVDSLNHLVYKQITLEKDPVGESLYAITDNYYVFIDEVVGKISESLADNTILMIASDHGWTNEEAHTYAPPGLILMKGKSVKRGCRIEGASILDITPTILYLKGLPVAQDMDGRPLISCVDGDFLEEQAVAYLPTYEDNAQTTRAGPVESLVDEEMDEQLRALGYIK